MFTSRKTKKAIKIFMSWSVDKLKAQCIFFISMDYVSYYEKKSVPWHKF